MWENSLWTNINTKFPSSKQEHIRREALTTPEAAASPTDYSDEDTEDTPGSVEVDANGFVVGPGISNSIPQWQLSRMKQEQRLQKWRAMLGKHFCLLLDESALLSIKGGLNCIRRG